MPASAWITYDAFKTVLGDSGIDLNDGVIKCALMTDTYVPDRAADAVYGDISAAEVANGVGYTTGGATLNATWTQPTSGTAMFDAANPSWTASGGDIEDIRYAVVYLDGSTDTLICYCELDDEAFDVLDGQTLAIALHASGILRLSGAIAA